MKTITITIIAVLFLWTINAQNSTNSTNATNCATWNSTANYTTCLNCTLGYFLSTDLTTCLSSATYGCNVTGNYQNGTGCTVCSSGTGLQANFSSTNYTGCANCALTNCGNCLQNYSSCLSCSSGYFFSTDQTTCLSAASYGCDVEGDYEDGEGCVACSAGTGLQADFNYTEYSACVTCEALNCGICSQNYLSCESCSPGYFFLYASNQTCQSSSLWSCSASQNYFGCTACQNGYGINTQFNITLNTSGQYFQGCSACNVNNCNTCFTNYSVCSGCATNFLLQNSTTCFESSLLNCSNSNYQDYVGCTSCSGILGLAPGSSNTTNLTMCSACTDSNCENCNSNINNCSSCYNPFITQSTVNTSVCVNPADYNCSTSYNNQGCITCNDGFGINNSIANWTSCSPCSTGCGLCGSNFTTCQNCSSGYIPYNTTYSYTYISNISNVSNASNATTVTANVSACLSCQNQLYCPNTCSAGDGCSNGCGNGSFTTVSTFGFSSFSMCQNCSTNCTTCTNSTSCSNCTVNNMLMNSTANYTQFCVSSGNYNY